MPRPSANVASSAEKLRHATWTPTAVASFPSPEIEISSSSARFALLLGGLKMTKPWRGNWEECGAVNATVCNPRGEIREGETRGRGRVPPKMPLGSLWVQSRVFANPPPFSPSRRKYERDGNSASARREIGQISGREDAEEERPPLLSSSPIHTFGVYPKAPRSLSPASIPMGRQVIRQE
ncbi:hypothetical protein GQ53DRAFT_136880 [Thozetella sp. PMI_491]|nr:hypothetical protein GQ53DRAFT_136880 [Thozetella sp. PMI_491]